MVNTSALAVIAIILVAILGGGYVLGAMMDSSPEDPGSDTDTPVEDTPADETPTAAEPSPTATPTAADGGTPTATATPTETGTRTPMLPRRFNTTEIGNEIVELINERRAEDGLDPLSTDGRTETDLSRVASEHSVAIADAGTVARNVSGVDVGDRYRRAELFDTCKYTDGETVWHPENNEDYVALDREPIGVFVDRDGERVFVDSERQAAEMLVEDMLNNNDVDRGLVNQRLSKTGVGVEITRANEVYAAVYLCN